MPRNLLIHRIRNVGDETFRLIAVTNSGPPAPTDGPEDPTECFPARSRPMSSIFGSRGSRWRWVPIRQHLRSPFPVVVVQVSAGRTDLAVDGVSPDT